MISALETARTAQKPAQCHGVKKQFQKIQNAGYSGWSQSLLTTAL